MPETIAFVHIGRTGGLSVCAMLAEQFGLRFLLLPSHPDAAAQALSLYSLEGLGAIAGHVFASHVPRWIRRVTVLREPGARFLSAFYFTMQNSDHVRHPEAVSWESFTSSPLTANEQVRMLAGVPMSEPVERCHLNAALSELQQMSLVGMTENLPLFLKRLGDLLLWETLPELPHINSSEGPRSTEMLDKAREINALDVELYTFARKELSLAEPVFDDEARASS
jgi:hypothetical protein